MSNDFFAFVRKKKKVRCGGTPCWSFVSLSFSGFLCRWIFISLFWKSSEEVI